MAIPIRVLVVDDHPAVRAGLESLIRSQPDMQPVAGADCCAEAIKRAAAADLVIADYALPDGDGICLCRRLKSHSAAPRLVLYSAYSTRELALPALLAGADGLASKGSRAADLFELIRAVAAGEPRLPVPSPSLLRAAGERLGPEQLPIIGLMLSGTPLGEVASTLGIARSVLEQRIDSMLGVLKPSSATSSGQGAGHRPRGGPHAGN